MISKKKFKNLIWIFEKLIIIFNEVVFLDWRFFIQKSTVSHNFLKIFKYIF